MDVLEETVFRSEDLPPAERFDAWRACLRRSHAALEVSSGHAAGYRARQRLLRLGGVAVWPAVFEQAELRRTPRLVAAGDPQVLHLSLLLRGGAVVTRGRTRAVYGPFDIHTSDSGRPYAIRTGEEPLSCVGVEVPLALLPMPPERAVRAVGRPLSGREGLGGLFAQFLLGLSAGTGGCREQDGPRLGLVVTDLVTALLAGATESGEYVPPQARARTLRLRIRAYIGRNLLDPRLSPDRIAAAHHVSRSYLHRLFQDEPETVAALIRRLRLAGAHRDLADPAQALTPIHVVGERWCFPRASDFTRAFRAVYRVSPSDHRRLALRVPAEQGAR